MSRRRGGLVLVVAAMLVLAGLGYYLYPRPSAAPVPPSLELGDADPLVVGAINAARDGAVREPQSAAAWGKLGMVLLAHEYNSEALVCLARAEQLDVRDARWPYYQGVLLERQRPAEAVAALARAAARSERDATPRLRLAEALYALDRLDEAEAQFRQAGRPDDPRVLLGLGLIARRHGDLNGCVRLLERAAASPHARRAAGSALADAQQRLGNTAAAERAQAAATQPGKDLPWPDPLLDQALQWQTGTRPRLNQVNLLLNSGRAGEALQLARQIVRDDPGSDLARLALGLALLGNRDYNAAEEVFAEAARRWPDSQDAHLLRGDALREVGRYGDAADSYRRVIALNAAHAMAHFHLAGCLRRAGDRPGARAALADALRARPDLVAAHVELAEILLQDGDRAAAISHLHDALRVSPADAPARRLLAEVEKTKK